MLHPISVQSDGTILHSIDCEVCEVMFEILSLQKAACMTDDLSHAKYLHSLELKEWEKYHSFPIEKIYNCSKDLEIMGELLSQGNDIP